MMVRIRIKMLIVSMYIPMDLKEREQMPFYCNTAIGYFDYSNMVPEGTKNINRD